MQGWTFLTNHAQVFLCVAANQRSTARQIAAKVGITERAVQRILDDLEESGYITRFREGRSNHYEIHPEQPMRTPPSRAIRWANCCGCWSKGGSRARGDMALRKFCSDVKHRCNSNVACQTASVEQVNTSRMF
ncbi:MAG: hypothetical protein OHK0022_22100 [Roseiflexaceae bacterium]